MMTFVEIGAVCSTRKEIKDDEWDKEKVFIELDSSRFTAESLLGLETFSHVEVLFYMHGVNPEKIESVARHPRGNLNWPRIGIFSQRGKNRPNQIGTTVCRVLKVDGTRLYLEGLDAIDGTPVLDIKPWVVELGPRGEVCQPSWMNELMKNYWK